MEDKEYLLAYLNKVMLYSTESKHLLEKTYNVVYATDENFKNIKNLDIDQLDKLVKQCFDLIQCIKENKPVMDIESIYIKVFRLFKWFNILCQVAMKRTKPTYIRCSNMFRELYHQSKQQIDENIDNEYYAKYAPGFSLIDMEFILQENTELSVDLLNE